MQDIYLKPHQSTPKNGSVWIGMDPHHTIPTRRLIPSVRNVINEAKKLPRRDKSKKLINDYIK